MRNRNISKIKKYLMTFYRKKYFKIKYNNEAFLNFLFQYRYEKIKNRINFPVGIDRYDDYKVYET